MKPHKALDQVASPTAESRNGRHDRHAMRHPMVGSSLGAWSDDILDIAFWRYSRCHPAAYLNLFDILAFFCIQGLCRKVCSSGPGQRHLLETRCWFYSRDGHHLGNQTIPSESQKLPCGRYNKFFEGMKV